MMVVTEIDDIFLPLPDDLLVNLSQCKENFITILKKIGGNPREGVHGMFSKTHDVKNCLGSAIQAATKIIVIMIL